jgi:hypothetical protein
LNCRRSSERRRGESGSGPRHPRSSDRGDRGSVPCSSVERLRAGGVKSARCRGLGARGVQPPLRRLPVLFGATGVEARGRRRRTLRSCWSSFRAAVPTLFGAGRLITLRGGGAKVRSSRELWSERPGLDGSSELQVGRTSRGLRCLESWEPDGLVLGSLCHSFFGTRIR